MADSPQALLARHVFMTFIAGVDHRLHAAQDATFGLGEPLVLIPEPDNPFDPDALGVWNADRTLQAGYVPAVIADRLEPANRTATAIYEFVESGRRVNIGILVSRERATIRPSPRCLDRTEWVQSRVAKAKRDWDKARARQATVIGDPMEQMARLFEALPERHETE